MLGVPVAFFRGRRARPPPVAGDQGLTTSNRWRLRPLASGGMMWEMMPSSTVGESTWKHRGGVLAVGAGANAGVSKGSNEAVAELAASVGDEASRWRPCGRSSSDQ